VINLGPLLQKELMVLARRRRTFWLRAGALGILTLLMIPLLIQLVVQSDRAYSVQGVAEVLFQIFVWTQFGLLVMAAPAFSAGAISYERRLGTIDLLKLASIRSPQLTVGKFLGAAALPALLVVSEIPFLFIWTLFGGISPESILATLTLSACMTVLLIGIGLFTSAITDTAGIAMVVSYGLALVYLMAPAIVRPFLPAGWDSWFIHTSLFHQLSSPGITPYPWWHAGAAALVAAFALSILASLFLVQPPSVQRVLDRTSVGSKIERRSRRVWSQPILWREIYCGGGRKVTAFLNLATAISVACFAAAAMVRDDHWRNVLGGITVALPPIAGGVLGAISVSLEKEGKSIAALLLMPQASTTVVLGKFAGACTRTLPLAIVPALLGYVRLDWSWMMLSLTSGLLSLLLVSTGTLFSVIFAKTAVSVAVTFAGTVFYTFCCCYNGALFMPFMLMNNQQPGDLVTVLVIFAITAGIYGVIIATVLAIAVGMFETRAREAT
jgi:ABC-type transport system involved in multi-copper enzyme maturation permease subunit